MQIVILTAGRGTRMKELTDNVPKNMLPIKGKPVLAYKLEALPTEIDEVIFVIGYLGNQIKEYFGDFYGGRKISYVVQEKQDGTGGAVHLIKDLVNNDFLVMNGDDLYAKQDVAEIMKYDLAMLALEVDEPKKFGIISLNENGNLIEIIEKPDIDGPALANIGVYKLRKKFFDYQMILSPRGEYELIEPLTFLAKDFPVHVQKATNWFPIGNPDDLEKAQEIIEKFI